MKMLGKRVMLLDNPQRGPVKVSRSYVYIVLEHDNKEAIIGKTGKAKLNGKSAIVHGVYINPEEAAGKFSKIYYQARKDGKESDLGYIAILKKPLEGKSL